MGIELKHYPEPLELKIYPKGLQVRLTYNANQNRTTGFSFRLFLFIVTIEYKLINLHQANEVPEFKAEHCFTRFFIFARLYIYIYGKSKNNKPTLVV